jgi:hypothetical protein
MSSSEPNFPDPYSTITVSEVSFTGNTGPVQAEAVPPYAYGPGLDPSNFSTEADAFVVGIHAIDPPIGSGDPQSRDSLIGFKILETGEYTDIEVPIFPYGPDIGPAQVFPPTPNGTTEIEGTLWHDVGTDYGATQGVIQIDGSVNASANITDLDRNTNRKPIGQAPRDPVWTFVGERGPKTFDDSDDPRFGEAVDVFNETVTVGAPLEDHSVNVGSAYVLNGIFKEFEPSDAGLDESKIEEGAQFGTSVAIGFGGKIAVGAPNDDSGSGAVYVFDRNTEGPSSLIKKISGDSPGDDFGTAVQFSLETEGDDPSTRVLAGAPNAGTGGKVKVTDIDGSGKVVNSFSLSPSGLGGGAEFGSSIGIRTPLFVEDGARFPALIGAPGAAPGGTDQAGKAYLYETVSDTASPKELTAASIETNARFGSAVDLRAEDGDLLLAVGAPGSSDDIGTAALFNMDKFFTESPDALELENTFSDPDGSPGDKLGTAVALTDVQNVLAGAPGGGYATLFDESEFRDVAGHFTRPGDVSTFGVSVATSLGQVVIGAPGANGGGAAFIYQGPGGVIIA